MCVCRAFIFMVCPDVGEKKINTKHSNSTDIISSCSKACLPLFDTLIVSDIWFSLFISKSWSFFDYVAFLDYFCNAALS